MNDSSQAPRPETDRLIVGTLLAHGRGSQNGVASYYARVQTARGERVIWSAGLERAFLKSKTQPQVGEPVGLRENGTDRIIVEMYRRDSQGQRVLAQRAEGPRPHWVVERREFFDERLAAANALRDPRISSHDAVLEHPELLGAYSVLYRAIKLSLERFRSPDHRVRFLALFREALARTAEMGEPLPPAQARDRSVLLQTPENHKQLDALTR